MCFRRPDLHPLPCNHPWSPHLPPRPPLLYAEHASVPVGAGPSHGPAPCGQVCGHLPAPAAGVCLLVSVHHPSTPNHLFVHLFLAEILCSSPTTVRFCSCVFLPSYINDVRESVRPLKSRSVIERRCVDPFAHACAQQLHEVMHTPSPGPHESACRYIGTAVPTWTSNHMYTPPPCLPPRWQLALVVTAAAGCCTLVLHKNWRELPRLAREAAAGFNLFMRDHVEAPAK